MSDNAPQNRAQIAIERLETTCVIGLNDWEREVRQKVTVDIVLTLAPDAFEVDDNAPPPTDYRALTKRVLNLTERSSFRLLESLANAIAAECLSDAAVVAAEVAVGKPGALRHAQNVSARLTRVRSK